jgi:hypothetical protein
MLAEEREFWRKVVTSQASARCQFTCFTAFSLYLPEFAPALVSINRQRARAPWTWELRRLPRNISVHEICSAQEKLCETYAVTHSARRAP